MPVDKVVGNNLNNYEVTEICKEKNDHVAACNELIDTDEISEIMEHEASLVEKVYYDLAALVPTSNGTTEL